MGVKRRVHLIDDDPAILESTAGFLQTRGFAVRTYGAAREFLDLPSAEVGGVVVTDVQMNGMTGIDLAAELRARRISIPIIIVTAYADISVAVRAMRCGAVNLLEKPFSNTALVNSIREALARWGEIQAAPNFDAIKGRFGALTSREREVLAGLLKGSSNKIIAHELGLSTRTVETHRATIMSKMDASSLAELVRMSLAVV
jgi:two-component system response regulator FixJ